MERHLLLRVFRSGKSTLHRAAALVRGVPVALLWLALGFGLGVAVGASTVEGPAAWLQGFFNQDFWKNVAAGGVVLLLVDVPLTVLIVQRVVESQAAKNRYRAWLRSSGVARASFERRLKSVAREVRYLGWAEETLRKNGERPWGPRPEDSQHIEAITQSSGRLRDDARLAVTLLQGDVPVEAVDALAALLQSSENLARFTAEHDPRRMGRPDRWLAQIEIDTRNAARPLQRLEDLVNAWEQAVPVPQVFFGPFDPA
jgi:hypothetical protein